MSEIIAGTYELREKLGSGGGGNVFLAYHLRLGKEVVLKADKRKLTTSEALLRREVDVLKNLSHPYIPHVYDFFVDGETVYTVMDYIQGESLDRPLKRGEHYSQAQVIQWATELLEALCYLHSPIHGNPPRGFVHSDIKPANLMRTPDNHICLIDFNIALALGEQNVIGRSAGYASPEHYGLDFSENGEDDITETMEGVSVEDDRTVTMTMRSSIVSKRVIVPDVRSDIYSTGATLYHLLSGIRPARDAREVVPLSAEEFSPQIVHIITKSMEPNPDHRYQTAEEMLYDFRHLRENDPRMKKYKRQRLTAGVLFPVLLAAGAAMAFTGLKRMQTEEMWLKLAANAESSLQNGNTGDAIKTVLQAFPEKRNFLTPESPAEAQKVLTEALGVYDLADGYKNDGVVRLSSAPLNMEISPDGTTGAVICEGTLSIIDLESGKILDELPTDSSALAQVKYVDEQKIIYAGQDGIAAYDLDAHKVIWTGKAATAIAVSADETKAAAVYKDESKAIIYQVFDGTEIGTIDFNGGKQSVTVNDQFANPEDSLLALNQDGSQLAVSFNDGALKLFPVMDQEDAVTLMEAGSGYGHYEGGFSGKYFAFSASNAEKSSFAIVDTAQMEQTGGFESESFFGVQTDEDGIYVQNSNLLVQIDPVTGEQQPLVDTAENIQHFAKDADHTLLAQENGFAFYDSYGNLLDQYEQEESYDFVRIAGTRALLANRDDPSVRIMKYEDYAEAEAFSYDPTYEHDEARISEDGKTAMLFSYDRFRIISTDGTVINDTELPNAEEVYDQQYIRDDENSRLEVTYNDGTIRSYRGDNGEPLNEQKTEAPDLNQPELFETDRLEIESPLHGTATARGKKSGKTVGTLKEDAYLTYVTQTDAGIIAQYVTADGECFGELLDDTCEVLAELPYLTDVVDDELVFDYSTGDLRMSKIYGVEELVEMGEQELQDGEKTVK